ncbi:MAG: hypothetical protein ACI85O_002549 [Saprospiraceae bacterium]|jgi:hypothetical protein
MLQTRLWLSIKSLPPRKKSNFAKFLKSPYFNQREDLCLLYAAIRQAIEKEKDLTKEDLWQILFSKQSYESSQLRLLMSYLQKLFEQFIATENLLEDKAQIKLQTTAWFRDKGEAKTQEILLKEAFKLHGKSSFRDADYHYHSFQLQQEKYRITSEVKPDKDSDFQQVIDDLDVAFLGIKLRESCTLLAHDRVYKWGFDAGFLEQVFDYLEEKDLLKIPAIAIYYYCYRMLQNSEKETYFQAFKKELLVNGHLFKNEEVQSLYLLAINYGIRRVNDGHRQYFKDIMDFYQEGLTKEYLLQNGILSRFTYTNIVSVALQINMSDWAEKFIEEWTPRLERRYRERMFSFNRAKVAYHTKDFDAAIPLLQRANYHDLLLNLGARTLLLKIYYELDEFDLLQSHLDAFSSYLRRKDGLGYHRTNYRNLIRYTNRLLSLNFVDKAAVQIFKENVEGEEILTEKEWLLRQL